jgi:hypothetical protein
MARINFEAIMKQVGFMCLVDKLPYNILVQSFFKAKLKHEPNK